MVADHPDVTVNDRSAISKIMKKLDTQQIHTLFYESHKEVDKIADHPDVTVNQSQNYRIVHFVGTDKMHQAISEITKNVDTGKICNLFGTKDKTGAGGFEAPPPVALTSHHLESTFQIGKLKAMGLLGIPQERIAQRLDMEPLFKHSDFFPGSSNKR